MRLIGGSHSPFVRRVAMVLESLGCEYTQEALRTDQDSEIIRQYNPVGRVPVLVLDDGRVIIDSHAILDYLERRDAGVSSLFPQREAARMQMLFADAVGVAALEKLVLWFYENTRRDPELRCAKTVAGYEEQIAATLSWLGETLAQGQSYLCGNELTLADITATSLVNTLAAVNPSLLEPSGIAVIQGLAGRVSSRLPSAIQ